MVIEKARELGIALSESQEFVRLVESHRAIEENPVLSIMLADYNEKQKEIVLDLESEETDTNRVEALSHDMETIQNTLLANETFSEMLAAQSEFSALMKRVNKIIGSCIGFDNDGENADGDCTGSCIDCQGCMH